VPSGPALKAGTPGSPTSGEPVYLAVGMLRRPHGVHGDLLMEVYTDFPERLTPGTRLFLGDRHQPFTLVHVRGHNDGLLVSLKGVATPEAAGRYRNMLVSVLAGDRPALPPGEYYHHQLLGLRVETDEGQLLGLLSEVLVTGANDVFVVTDAKGQELLLPVVDSVVLAVDLGHGVIKVHLIPGLVEGHSGD
jgi:16S rRNA processing protein RimM